MEYRKDVCTVPCKLHICICIATCKYCKYGNDWCNA